MKSKPARIIVIGLIAAGCVGSLARAAEKAPAKPKRGQMPAVIVEKPPPIDGVGEAGVWAKCPELALGECTTEKPGPMKTTARVLFDATRLYVAFACAESDTGSLVQTVAERDGPVWRDDSVELFVTGDIRRGYYHFAVNPRGTLFDTRTFGGKKDDTSYNSSAQVKAAIRKGKGWTVTLAVPLKEIGAYVGDNQTWIVNLNRTRPARGGKPMLEWSWAIMSSNDYHQVSDFGKIAGVKIPKREDGVTRTASRPPPPPSYNKGTKAGSVIVYRHFEDMEIRDRGKGIAKGIDLRIRGSKALKVAFLARATGGVKSVPFNMADRRSNDNTTSRSYRLVGEKWQPMLYYVNRFRYNSRLEGNVAASTDYSNIRFHSMPTADGKGRLYLRDFTIYRGEDTMPPPAPQGLTAAAGDKGVALTWKRVKDNVGVGLYVISRAGKDGKFAKIAESPLPEFLDKPPAGSYRYRVLAADFQDNLSKWSKPASAKAAKGFEAAKPTDLETDRAGYAEHVRKIAKAGAGKVVKGRVFCFGDSLTGATMYRVYTEAAVGRYPTEAIGRAGWRTGQGRTVIAGDIARMNPQFCLILYGTNNSKSAKAIEAGMDDLLAIAKACETNGTIPVIGTIPPRGFSDPASKPEASYNAALIKTCRANKIPIAYIFEGLQKQPDRKKLLSGDGVHFVSGGWAVVGPAWSDAVKQVNFVLLDRPD